MGRRLLHRAQLQQGVGGVRPRRPGGVAGPGPDGARSGQQRPSVRSGTRTGRRPAGAIPHRGPGRHRCAARRPRRLCRCHGSTGRGVSRRHRCAGPGRRRTAQCHRVGAVGHQHGRTGAGLAGGRGQADPGRCPGHACRPRASHDPAPVSAHHGDVGHPAGRAARGRPAARASYPTPAISSTCPAISTCCAAPTALRWWRICLRCKPIDGSSSAKGR